MWPRGARAAVSLTYDDALASQRENALPRLAAHRLPATFFLVGRSDDLTNRRADWQAIAKAGHELAAHTMHHPCDKSFAWVRKGFAIQDYDLARMEGELRESIAQLRELGATEPFSFAYPCGETSVGENRTSYIPIVRRLFAAARGVSPAIANPKRDSLDLVPAIDGAKDKEDLVRLVESAAAESGWLVFLFHGVGGDHLAITQEAHEALLTYLDQHRDTLWTERFGVVASHLRETGHAR